MKFLKKTLSVGLSLVLCASMASPAFAAVAFDKNTHVDNAGALLSHKETVDGTEVDSYDYYLNADVQLDKTLVIKDGVNASIDLKGYELSLNKDLDVDTDKAQVTGVTSDTKQGSVISVTGQGTNLTVTDTEGTGTISGGYNQPGYKAGFGGGISVDDNASLDLQGGTITNNVASNGGGVYVGKGTVTMGENAKIDRNLATMAGGGVYLNTELASRTGNKAVFTMNGGTISYNTASGTDANGNIVGGGGGVGTNLYKDSPNPDYTAIVIDGGTLTGNKAEVDGAGIYVNNGKVSIANSTITDNIAKNIQEEGTLQRGGGIFASGNKTQVTVTNSTISNNEATQGGGIYAQQGATVKLNGSTTVTKNDATTGGGIFNSLGKVTIGSTSSACKVYANTATNHSDDVYSYGGILAIYATTNNAGASLKEGEEERAVTGWYMDKATNRWGSGYTGYTMLNPGSQWTNGILYMKAAHNQYFGVSYYLDEDATELYNGDFEAEKGFALPEFNVDNPEKVCHIFAGWNVVDGVDDGKVTGEVKYVAQWTENHTPGEAVRENEVPAQVGVAGSYDEVVYCSVCGEELSREPHTIDALPAPAPEEPTITVEDPDVPLGDEPEVDIEDPAVPLASGPVTRAEFVDYLWRHEGEPAPVQDDGLFEDVTEEHEYSPAMAWAKSIGIIEAYEDGTFEPDELVTVSAVRSILTRFAAYADMTMPALTTLTGAEDEAVLNCDEVLAEFFGEEYAPAKSEDIDIAA